MKVFLDTDVILDYLTDRHPFADQSEKVFALIEHRKIDGLTSVLTFSNLYYLIRQQSSHHKTMGMLKNLAEVLNILRTDEEIVRNALNSAFRDFEDALQYFSATGHRKIDVIVTRNIRDYKDSLIPVMTPDTLVRTCKDAGNKS